MSILSNSLGLVVVLSCAACSDAGSAPPKTGPTEDAASATNDSAPAPDAADAALSSDGGRPNHEPAGYKLITEYGFGAPIPSQADGPMGDGSGWGVVNSGYATSIVDPTGPVSPTSMQLLYPKGWAEGESPATLYYTHPSAKGVYCELWWKASNPWEDNNSKVNKLFIWFSTRAGILTTDLVPQFYNGHIEVVNGYPELAGGAVRYPPNVTTTVITLGVWHQVEFWFEYGSSPNTGAMKWWVDGVLQGAYTGLVAPNDDGLDQFNLSPTWGGNDPTKLKTENDYFWYNHIRLSHR